MIRSYFHMPILAAVFVLLTTIGIVSCSRCSSDKQPEKPTLLIPNPEVSDTPEVKEEPLRLGLPITRPDTYGMTVRVWTSKATLETENVENKKKLTLKLGEKLNILRTRGDKLIVRIKQGIVGEIDSCATNFGLLAFDRKRGMGHLSAKDVQQARGVYSACMKIWKKTPDLGVVLQKTQLISKNPSNSDLSSYEVHPWQVLDVLDRRGQAEETQYLVDAGQHSGWISARHIMVGVDPGWAYIENKSAGMLYNNLPGDKKLADIWLIHPKKRLLIPFYTDRPQVETDLDVTSKKNSILRKNTLKKLYGFLKSQEISLYLLAAEFNSITPIEQLLMDKEAVNDYLAGSWYPVPYVNPNSGPITQVAPVLTRLPCNQIPAELQFRSDETLFLQLGEVETEFRISAVELNPGGRAVFTLAIPDLPDSSFEATARWVSPVAGAIQLEWPENAVFDTPPPLFWMRLPPAAVKQLIRQTRSRLGCPAPQQQEKLE